jgi:uncharacterized membrane protein
MGPLQWFNTRWGRIAVAIYAIVLIVGILPQLVTGVREGIPNLIKNYKKAFTVQQRTYPTTDTVLPVTTSEAVVQKKLAELESEVGILRRTDTTARIDNLDMALKDLRATLFGDPTRALTIQRLTAEQTSLASRVGSLQTQMQWLFGILMTLALGVLAVVISVVKSSFEKKLDERKTDGKAA